ncbi:hypothetical protein FACS1894188_13630 [Clostridia bacterium]|nr:hypothetical protein FACS1894188_13630 [Clostridia bacterium]
MDSELTADSTGLTEPTILPKGTIFPANTILLANSILFAERETPADCYAAILEKADFIGGRVTVDMNRLQGDRELLFALYVLINGGFAKITTGNIIVLEDLTKYVSTAGIRPEFADSFIRLMAQHKTYTMSGLNKKLENLIRGMTK